MKPTNKSFIFAVLLLTTSLIALTACGGGNQVNTANNNTEAIQASSADLELGLKTFQANCSPCHATQKDTVLVGPSMDSIADRAGEMVDGMDAESYLRQSILEPEAFMNEGYQNVMPATYGQQLSEEEIDALVAYLFTFE